MGLNSQVSQANLGAGDSLFIFKKDVKYRHMTGKDPIIFRVLPSFDPRNPDPRTSCLPFMLPGGPGGEDQLSDWGCVLYITRFVGHGKGGNGTRRDLLSPRSFDGAAFDPLTHLYKTVSQMSADWGYLLEDRTDGSGPGGKGGKVLERAAFGKPLPHFICNILDLNKPTDGIRLGCFTSSAYNSMFNTKNGLVHSRVNLADESILQQNYLAAYAVGDLTHPTNGPALVAAKGNENGEFSKYVVTLAQDSTGRIVKRQISMDELAQRYNMSHPDTFINIPTEAELIQALTELLCMRSPGGHHEYALLKLAFPNYRIPDPPAAPAATPTIATSGFGVNPATVTPPGVTSPVSPMAVAPAVVIPGMPPPAPVYPPPVYAGMGMPVAPAPVAPVAVPMPAPGFVAPPSVPEAAAAVANMQAAAVAPAPVAPAPVAPGAPVAPVVPGDDVGVKGFNKNDFMARLEAMSKQQK